jgi:hypothetical protein
LDRVKGIQQALRTLRGLRQRYEAERDMGSEYVRPLQVTLDYSDMLWITAVIEALENAGVVEAA